MRDQQEGLQKAPEQTPGCARSSVMDSLANMPFIPPMGHRWRHHSRRSKNHEHTIAPAVIKISSQPERYAVSGKSHTSSHTRITKKSAHRNHGPHSPTAQAAQHLIKCEAGGYLMHHTPVCARRSHISSLNNSAPGGEFKSKNPTVQRFKFKQGPKTVSEGGGSLMCADVC